MNDVFRPNPGYPNELPGNIENIIGAQEAQFSGGHELRLPWARRRRRNAQLCYEAAGQWYTERDVRYTEGRALSRQTGLWVPHAWLTHSDGTAIDLAWRQPGHEYRGISLDDDVVTAALYATGRFGPLLPAVIS